jgi:hypothetical protein
MGSEKSWGKVQAREYRLLAGFTIAYVSFKAQFPSTLGNPVTIDLAPLLSDLIQRLTSFHIDGIFNFRILRKKSGEFPTKTFFGFSTSIDGSRKGSH